MTKSFKWSYVKIMWLVGFVIMTLQLPFLLDASSVECRSCLLRNENLVKNLPTNEVEWGGKPGDKWEHPSPVEKLMSLNMIISLVKNLPTQWRETEEENRWLFKGGKVVNEKPPNPMTGDWGGKPMSYDWGVKNSRSKGMKKLRSRSFDWNGQLEVTCNHVQRG